MKAAVITLGCKANQADSLSLTAILEDSGYEIVPWPERADLYIINTCTVTASSDRQSRQALRQAKRRNPAALIVATGCYAQTSPQALASLGQADLILGNREKFDLPRYLQIQRKQGGSLVVASTIPRGIPLLPLPMPHRLPRTRPLLKIQDGCEGNCTYCIVPRARGPQRSLSPVEVKRKLAELIERGFREVVLTGIRLGAYGLDLPDPSGLAGLLRQLQSIPGKWRLRLSSLEPHDISEDLLSLWKEGGRLCRHLHLPLQSGDDEILARMGRPATVAAYWSLMEGLLRQVPDICLGADIIVGFPGETERHFRRTYDFLQQAPLAYLHVFPFSPRPGTAAATLPDAPPAIVKKQRVRLLRSLGKEKSLRFRSRFIGRSLEVLVLPRQGPASHSYPALADNYLPLSIQGIQEELVGRLVQVEVQGMEEGILTARWKK